MYSIKLATIFQVILLLLALGIITVYYIMGCVGIGLHGNVSFENLVNAYKYAAIFIASLLILSLLLRNHYILSAGGIIVFIVMVTLFCFLFIKRSFAEGFDVYDLICIATELLLLVNSIGYLKLTIQR